MARHGGGPFGSAARDATARPYVGSHRATPGHAPGCLQQGDISHSVCPVDRPGATAPPYVVYDEWLAPDDPPRCTSCGHQEADECGCTCCTWTCDERPADV